MVCSTTIGKSVGAHEDSEDEGKNSAVWAGTSRPSSVWEETSACRPQTFPAFSVAKVFLNLFPGGWSSLGSRLVNLTKAASFSVFSSWFLLLREVEKTVIKRNYNSPSLGKKSLEHFQWCHTKEGHFFIFAIGNWWTIKHPEGPHILFVSNWERWLLMHYLSNRNWILILCLISVKKFSDFIIQV